MYVEMGESAVRTRTWYDEGDEAGKEESDAHQDTQQLQLKTERDSRLLSHATHRNNSLTHTHVLFFFSFQFCMG